MQPPLPFTLHQRKIDLSKNVSVMDGWHHEVIPRSRPNLRILAATVSSQSSFNAASRSSILDRTPAPLAKLQRDFEFATRAVSKMLYSPHAAPSVLKSTAYLSSSEFIKVASETVAVRHLFPIHYCLSVCNLPTQITPRASAYTAPPSALLDSIASLMSAGSGQSRDPCRPQHAAAANAVLPGEMSKQTLRLDGPTTHYTSVVATMQGVLPNFIFSTANV
jgi:hypothetical protein